MSVKYEIVPATAEHILELAQTMRKADVDEVWAAAHRTPLEALQVSVACSSETFAGLADGRVICVFGVASATLLSVMGIPWMLGSEELPKHARAFLRRNKSYIRWLKSEYKLLANYVDSRHTDAIRWLKWLGFKLDPALPFGPDQVPFHRFEMRA